MRFKLLRNFLLVLPILAYSASAFSVYKVRTAASGDDTAAEVTVGTPDTAEFWVQAEPGGDLSSLVAGLTASGAASLTSDFTLSFPSSCQVEGSGSETITFSASSTGANTYDMTLGGSSLTCGGGAVTTPCKFTCVITINAVDDDIDEDTEGLTLTLDSGPAVKDPKFQNFNISDNDSAALVVTDSNWNGSDPISLTPKETSEDGGQDTFWVELATQPLSTVTVDLAVSDTGEALISSGGSGDVGALELTFTTGNWNTGQQVTITGQDDDPANPQDGNTPYQVTVVTTDETDDKYDNKVGGPVNGVNADNDEPGQLRFTQSNQSGAEGDSLVLLVERINGASSEVTIDYQINNGSASASDYTDTTASNTLTWGVGVSGTQSITIDLENDTLWEPSAEDFTVALLEGSITGGATLLTPNTQTVTINPSDPVTIAISAPDPDPVPEGDTGDADVPVDFEVTYSGGTLASPMTISWQTVDGTATGGADYDSVASSNINLPVNGAAVTITVNVNGDDDPEGNETFSVQLSESLDFVTLAGGGTSVATIQDDDASDDGTFSITDISPNPVMESAGTVTVTVSRIGNTVNSAATINYATANGTAVEPGDYTDTSGALVWALDDADAFKTFNIAIQDNAAGEPDETFTVTITPAAAEVVGIDSGSVTIIGDPTVTFNPTNYTVSEDGGSVTVFVARANVDDNPVAVDYTTTDGTAVAGDDYTTTSGTLNWTAGELVAKPINIPILADADATGPETFTVDLSGCNNCSIIAGQATVTVEEGEVSEATPGTLAFSPTLIQVGEGSGTASVFVTRTGGTDGIVSIGWETQPGTATSPQDFTASSGTLSWIDGAGGSRVIQVPIIDDLVVEPTQSFTVRFVPNSETGSEGDPTVGANTATVNITDDDDPENPGEFSVFPKNVTEGDGVITVSVNRDVGSSGAVSVDFTTADGTALAGTDYTATNGTLNWADGDAATKTIPITILDDVVVEPEELFVVTLSNPQGGATITNPSANVTIFDNDGGGTISVSDVTVFEPDQEATVTVTRLNDNNSAASIFWETRDVTAQDENGDNDYKSDSGELVWLDGDTSDTRTVTIDIVPDDKTEGNEWFTVTITSVQGDSIIVSKADGVITIKDPIPIPTLNQWAMGLLVLLLLGLGMYSLPVRRTVTMKRK